MTLCFRLSMPGVSSWDGRWSGEGRLFAIVKAIPDKKAQPLDGKYFSYDFGDGWRAGVDIRRMDTGEARTLRRKSEGFCGYDWMVDEILTHGRILTLAERRQQKVA